MLVTCLNCGTVFNKSTTNINKSPNHFCSCSCAASFNNRKTPKRSPEGHCRVCQKPIPTDKTWCSETCRNYLKPIPKKPHGSCVVAWRQRLKLKAITLKGGSCQICGYKNSVRAMVFHHLDPDQKDFSISTKNLRSWSRVQEELQKCILLCCRCHQELHDKISKLKENVAKSTIRRRSVKQQGITYLGGSCLICGYNSCSAALDFHHQDPTKKDFNISQAYNSWEKIKPELDKCVLLCSRCHGEIHSGLITLPTITNGSSGEARTPNQAVTRIQ